MMVAVRRELTSSVFSNGYIIDQAYSEKSEITILQLLTESRDKFCIRRMHGC
jgi:hypothetical protein